MSFIQNLFTSRDNSANGQAYIGQVGRLWYDPETNTLRVGNTSPGGRIISTGVANPFDQTLNTYNDVTFNNVTINGTLIGDSTGNIDLGNLYVKDQTIYGRNVGQDIVLYPAGYQLGNIRFNGNLIPDDNFFSLGTATTPWQEAYVGPTSLNILPDNPDNVIIVLQNENDILSVTAGGFAVDDATAGFSTFQVDPLGKVTIRSTDSTTVPPLQIFGSNNAVYTDYPYNGTLLDATGQDGNPSLLVMRNHSNTPLYGSNFVSVRARGTSDNPQAVQQDDALGGIVARGFDGNSLPITARNFLAFYASEDYDSTHHGAYLKLGLMPNSGLDVVDVLRFYTDGIHFLSSNPTNSGLTFQDGSFQNTAFNATSAVTSITTGAGFASPGTYTGAVSLDTTDVESLASANYSLTITDSGSKNLTLHLAQEIAPNSNPIFNNVTVGNLTVNGTLTTVTNAEVLGKILYLANNSTASSQIDGGGIILGNVNQSWHRSILYSLSNDWWDTDGSNLNTQSLYALNTTITGQLSVTGNAHLGAAQATVNYPNTDLQIDDNTNSYAQVVIQNHSSGTSVSADYVATAPNGTDTTYYIDMGMLGNNYNPSSPNNSIGTAATPNDGYLYVQGNTSATVGGNLVIGTSTANRNIVFVAGGVNSDNVVATAAPTIWTFNTNISASSNYIHNLHDPAANQDAATKYYVDSQVSTVTSNWQANAASQEAEIRAIQSNVSILQSNVTTLFSNASFQNTWLSNLQSNVSTLFANAASQETEIANLQSNVNPQYTYVLNSTHNMGTTVGPLSIFGVGITLTPGRYAYTIQIIINANTHPGGTSFGLDGTSTITKHNYQARSETSPSFNSPGNEQLSGSYGTNSTSATIGTFSNNYYTLQITGWFDVDVAGTVVPQLTFQNPPSAGCFVQPLSSINIIAYGSTSANTVIGPWS